MRFLFLVLGGVVFMAASARAESDFEIGGNADFFYAYNDVAKPYEDLQKNNVLQAAGNLNAAYSYFFSDETLDVLELGRIGVPYSLKKLVDLPFHCIP